MSKRIVIELTNRCNLKCEHCFAGRHGGNDDLSLDVLDNVLGSARALDFEHISFTGGDPTVHPHFPEVVRRTAGAGYRVSFVTNGWNFTTVYPLIAAYRDQLSVITFSVEGVDEETHDRLRGKGSFRRVMRAIAHCHGEGVPFTFNMVLTRHNRHQAGDLAELAEQLGARAVHFGHLMPSFLTTVQGFDLSPSERKAVEAEVYALRDRRRIRVEPAPGFHTTDLFPCAALNLMELNVDCRGNLTKCCHLSSHGGDAGDGDVAGSLASESFTDLYRRLELENLRIRGAKLRHLSSGTFEDTDFFPCWYCSLHYRKVDWLKRQFPNHPWSAPGFWEPGDEDNRHPEAGQAAPIGPGRGKGGT